MENEVECLLNGDKSEALSILMDNHAWDLARILNWHELPDMKRLRAPSSISNAEILLPLTEYAFYYYSDR